MHCGNVFMKKGIIGVVIFWLTVVGISFFWNIADKKKEHKQLAFETARAFFQQIVITRSWSAAHGGVYVPVSKDLQPNPYLEDPLRDLSTDQGLKLTKINPAYMTRQIAEITSRENDIKFHITSLRPIRPQNEAAEWEKEWLQSFELGVKEQGTFITTGSRSIFRYMAPLYVEDSCLKCHAKHGYGIGDVRGGISVVIPYFLEEKNNALIAGYGIIAVLGVILTIIGGTLLDRKRSLLLQANQSLKTESTERQKLICELQEALSQIKTLRGIVPICSYCKEIRDDKGYWNQLEEYISKHSTAQFSHGICPKCMKEHFPKINNDDP